MIYQEKEFKYKGRTILDNKWVYGAYMKQGNNHFIIPKVNMMKKVN